MRLKTKKPNALFFLKKQITFYIANRFLKKPTSIYKNLPFAWKCNKSSFWFVWISKMESQGLLVRFWSRNFIQIMTSDLDDFSKLTGLQIRYWVFWIRFSEAERARPIYI